MKRRWLMWGLVIIGFLLLSCVGLLMYNIWAIRQAYADGSLNHSEEHSIELVKDTLQYVKESPDNFSFSEIDQEYQWMGRECFNFFQQQKDNQAQEIASYQPDHLPWYKIPAGHYWIQVTYENGDEAHFNYGLSQLTNCSIRQQ